MPSRRCEGVRFLTTPTRDRTGRYLGRRSRNWKRTFDPRRFGRGIPDPAHEPSNWSSANRPGGPSGRQRSSLGSIHQRQGRPPVSGGDRRVSGDRPRRRSGGVGRRSRRPASGGRAATDPAARSRSAWMTRAALDQVRVVVDGPGHPVDVRRLEGRDLAERVVVELAERDDRGLGVARGTAPAAAGNGAAGRGRAGRSASMRAAARRRHGPARSGGWPRQRWSGPAPLPTAWLRGRNVSLVSTRPVTGRVGFGARRAAARRATTGLERRAVRRRSTSARPARSISRVSAA